MSTLAEIEVAVHALPVEQKRALYEFLASELAQSEPAGHGVMDIPVVNLGEILPSQKTRTTCSVRCWKAGNDPQPGHEFPRRLRSGRSCQSFWGAGRNPIR